MKENASEDHGKFPDLSRRQFLAAGGASALALYTAKSNLVRSALKTPSSSGARAHSG